MGSESAARLGAAQVEHAEARAAALRIGLMEMKCDCSEDCKVVECDLEGLVELFNRVVNAR